MNIGKHGNSVKLKFTFGWRGTLVMIFFGMGIGSGGEIAGSQMVVGVVRVKRAR